MDSRIRLRLVRLRGLRVYALMMYVNDQLYEIFFHTIRAEKIVDFFDRTAVRTPRIEGMNSLERRSVLDPVLAFGDHIDHVKKQVNEISVLNILSPNDDSACQQLWAQTQDWFFWENAVEDVDVDCIAPRFKALLIESKSIGVYPSPRVIVVQQPQIEIPQKTEPEVPPQQVYSRAETMQRMRREFEGRTSLPSILGFDAKRPGGGRQEPTPMDPEEFRLLTQQGVRPACEADWNDFERRIAAQNQKLDSEI